MTGSCSHGLYLDLQNPIDLINKIRSYHSWDQPPSSSKEMDLLTPPPPIDIDLVITI